MRSNLVPAAAQVDRAMEFFEKEKKRKATKTAVNKPIIQARAGPRRDTLGSMVYAVETVPSGSTALFTDVHQNMAVFFSTN